MLESEKNERTSVLEGLKRQFDSLFCQRDLSSDLVEHYASQLVNFGDSRIEIPNFWSLGYAKELSDLCRHYIKFFDTYERLCLDISALSNEMSAIKETIK